MPSPGSTRRARSEPKSTLPSPPRVRRAAAAAQTTPPPPTDHAASPDHTATAASPDGTTPPPPTVHADRARRRRTSERPRSRRRLSRSPGTRAPTRTACPATRSSVTARRSARARAARTPGTTPVGRAAPRTTMPSPGSTRRARSGRSRPPSASRPAPAMRPRRPHPHPPPPADTTAPSKPANVTAGTRTATSIALSWQPSTDDVGVVGYGMYRGGTRVGTSTATTWIFSGLTCGTNYTLAVDAADAAGQPLRAVGPDGLHHRLQRHPGADRPHRPQRIERQPDRLTLTWTRHPTASASRATTSPQRHEGRDGRNDVRGAVRPHLRDLLYVRGLGLRRGRQPIVAGTARDLHLDLRHGSAALGVVELSALSARRRSPRRSRQLRRSRDRAIRFGRNRDHHRRRSALAPERHLGPLDGERHRDLHVRRVGLEVHERRQRRIRRPRRGQRHRRGGHLRRKVPAGSELGDRGAGGPGPERHHDQEQHVQNYYMCSDSSVHARRCSSRTPTVASSRAIRSTTTARQRMSLLVRGRERQPGHGDTHGTGASARTRSREPSILGTRSSSGRRIRRRRTPTSTRRRTRRIARSSARPRPRPPNTRRAAERRRLISDARVACPPGRGARNGRSSP